MRLHRLEVTAFGPFAATECVDFDALAASGLFLFTGATGAGKTSILDAVCFALYGHVPGARDASRSMRSDHADERVRAQVVLEVTLRGRRLRITRSPQWDRPKLRGSGVTTEPAKVHLEERAPNGWTTLSTRLDETGQLVGRSARPQPRAVLPGGAAASGTVRRVPPCRRREASRAAGEPVRHPPFRRRGAVACRAPTGERSRLGRGRPARRAGARSHHRGGGAGRPH